MNGVLKWAAIGVAGLGVLTAPAVAAEAGVTVIRGTAGDAAAEPAAAGFPAVLRGWPAGSPRPVNDPAPERDPAGWIATGGEALWLVERDGGRVIGCWLQGSTQVGGTDVICGQSAWR